MCGWLARMAKELAQVPLRRHGVGHLEIYDVTVDELEQIEREGGNIGLDFQVSLFCITEASAFLAALLTMTTKSERTYTLFLILIVVGFLSGVVFGLRWLRSRKNFTVMLQKIRDRPIGPVGSEDHELEASELATLKSDVPEGSGK
jgi:hypothetical protein